jgi:hypothetical protein
MKLDTLAGSALAFDMGVIAEYKDFSFAMAVRDIADTRYNMIYTVPEKLANLNFSGTTLGNNFSFITPMSLTLGANWTPDLGDLSWLFRPQFQISYKTPLLLGYDELDLQGYTEQSFLSKLHLGGEIKLYSMLSLRAGLNGGYFTAGTGIDFRLGEFDFAIYSNELGSHSGQQPLAQLVEQRTVKACVTGSNPLRLIFCLHRLGVRTPGFHPGSGGSIPPGDENRKGIRG